MTLNLSIEIRNARGLSSSEKSILYSLSARLRPGVIKCYPSVPTLAADAGVHKRTAQRALKSLEKKGWITIVRKKLATKVNSASDYIIHLPHPSINKSLDNQNLIIPKLGGGAMSPPGGDKSPSGGSMSPEVSIQASKEDTKDTLSTGKEPKRLHFCNSQDAEKLINWFDHIGVRNIEFQALKRDKINGRGISGRSINIGDAYALNKEGDDIFIRPVRGINHPIIMLDDLDDTQIQRISSQWQSAVVETSSKNYQIWIVTSRAISESERKNVQKMLITTFGGDLGSVSGEHWGRSPGFINRKLDRNNFVSILVSAAKNGKLLHVDSVLDQCHVLDEKNVSKNVIGRSKVINKLPTFVSKSKSDDDSANEFGWCVGALRSGMPPTLVESILTDKCTERRGADALRYAKRTVTSALASI